MVYLISYDLNSDTGNYQEVYNELNSFCARCQCLESSWLVVSELTPKQVYDEFAKALHKGDRCFITQIRRNEYWGITTSSYEVWSWLDKHLTE